MAAFFWFGFMGIILLSDVTTSVQPGSLLAATPIPASQELVFSAQEAVPPTPSPAPQVDPLQVIAPYENYTLTQGPHGESYGHFAIDLSAGEGAVIRAPILGIVTGLFIDQWGNPNLVIENDYYVITLMHGHYSVNVNDSVDLGEPVGTESNQGYTTDYWGRSCKYRDCGYHTHLNIYDKRLGMNINPLDLIQP